MTVQSTSDYPEFGRLEHLVGSNWTRMQEIRLLGENWVIPLTVSIGKGGLEDNQLKACQLFNQTGTRVVSSCIAPLLEYLQEHGRKTLTQNGLLNVVKPEGIHFPRGRKKPMWGLLLDSIDDDKGIGIEVVENEIGRIGFQDLVL